MRRSSTDGSALGLAAELGDVRRLPSKRAPQLENLEAAVADAKVTRDIDEGTHQVSNGNRYSDVGYFSYSPLSAWSASLDIWKSGDATIGAGLLVADAVRHENAGLRQRVKMEIEWEAERAKRGLIPRVVSQGPEKGEMEEGRLQKWWDDYNALDETPSVWPQNPGCFLNIVEHLKNALPAKEARLDPRLLEEPAQF